jgi:hypothetical protein
MGNEREREFKASFEEPPAPIIQTDTGIWLTGDSVILGIRSALGEQFPLSLINARVGRQADELLEEILLDLPDAPTGPVVLNLGNNGALQEEQVVAILEALSQQKQIIIVDTAVPRPWRNQNNELIASISARYSNVDVVKWSEISDGHPEYFAPDGVHLVGAGVTVYVQAITDSLN